MSKDYKKLYEDALERAKVWKDKSGMPKDKQGILNDIFPELAESEDERIRNNLIDYFSNCKALKFSEQEIVAWLEKQGDRDEERKEINLVEILKHYPKETELFSPLYGKLWLAEVDEEHGIITCYRYPLDEGCTRAILEQEDTVSFYSDGTTGLPDYTVSRYCMLFLYNIEKQGEQKPFDYENANIPQKDFASKIEPKFKIGDSIKTANEESLTITEITDNGYWSEDLFICNFDDADKWELVEQKTIDKPEPKFKVGDVIRLKGGAAEYTIRKVTDTTYYTDGWSQSIERCEEDYELVEQKSTWSEEDEGMWIFTIKILNKILYKDNANWLKSLKERMQLV